VKLEPSGLLNTSIIATNKYLQRGRRPGHVTCLVTSPRYCVGEGIAFLGCPVCPFVRSLIVTKISHERL